MITRKVDRDDSHAGQTLHPVGARLAHQLAPRPLEVLCLQGGNIGGLPGNVHVTSLE